MYWVGESGEAGQFLHSGNSHVSLIRGLFDESRMPLHHIVKRWRVGVPIVAALHQNKRVLLESGGLDWIANRARVDEPTVHAPRRIDGPL